jgi:hypothetical protein
MARADRTALALEELLRTRPDQRDRLLPFVDRAKRYNGECGCRMAAIFMLASIGLALVYVIAVRPHSDSHTRGTIVGALAFCFLASIVGKLTGIILARVRLLLLYRRVRVAFPSTRE